MRRNNLFAKLLISVTALGCALLLVELAAQFTVNHLLHNGRLYQTDPELGWKPIPKLSRIRKNPDGKFWNIQINEKGFRGGCVWKDPAEKRLLILGDSFAFGQGVNLEERFDSFLSENRPSWSIVNLGVPGYGTDQELIAGRSYFRFLEPGDFVILLTSSADFERIMQKFHSGRGKPWFSHEKGSLWEHPPDTGPFQQLRDRSYLVGRVMWLLQVRYSTRITSQEYNQGMKLYFLLLKQELEPLIRRGILVVIAYHDMIQQGQIDHVENLFRELRLGHGFNTLPLEEMLDRPTCCFQDGHWNPSGHRIVGRALRTFIDELNAGSARGNGSHVRDSSPRT
jgi:hypothetical protein